MTTSQMERETHPGNLQQQLLLFLGSHDGKEVSLGGVGIVFKLYGKDTRGAFSVVEHPMKPKTLVPPHMHTDTDEFSIVVEGKIGARIGDREIEGGPGCYIVKPRNIPHTFWNPENTQSRLVEIISPPGFEGFFEESSKLPLGQNGLPEFSSVAKIGEKYHLVFGWDSWIPELSRKYGVKLFGL